MIFGVDDRLLGIWVVKQYFSHRKCELFLFLYLIPVYILNFPRAQQIGTNFICISDFFFVRITHGLRKCFHIGA